MKLINVAYILLSIGAIFSFITVVGYFAGEKKKKTENTKAGGRRTRRAESTQQASEEEMKSMVEKIQKYQADEAWEELADFLYQQKTAASTPHEFILCSLLEMGYRHNAEQHDMAKEIVLSLEQIFRKLAFNNNQYSQLVEMTLSFGYLDEAEVVVRQGLKLAIGNNEPQISISHLENMLANIMASTNRLEDAREKMETVKSQTGTSNPPLSISQHLATEEALFQNENGKVICKLTFKKNAGISTDSPKVKKTIFQRGYTLKCSFENPDSGKAPLVKKFTNLESNSETFAINFEYPNIKKGNYFIEIEIFEDSEQLESIGHHLVICQSEFEKR